MSALNSWGTGAAPLMGAWTPTTSSRSPTPVRSGTVSAAEDGPVLAVRGAPKMTPGADLLPGAEVAHPRGSAPPAAGRWPPGGAGGGAEPASPVVRPARFADPAARSDGGAPFPRTRLPGAVPAEGPAGVGTGRASPSPASCPQAAARTTARTR